MLYIYSICTVCGVQTDTDWIGQESGTKNTAMETVIVSNMTTRKLS